MQQSTIKGKTLGIVISDGVGFRNFILSDFMNEAKKDFNKIVIYSCLPIKVYDGYNLTCKIVEIEPFKESFITWVFRKGKELAHLQKFANENLGMNATLKANYNKAITIRGLVTRFWFLVTSMLHSEWWINFFYVIQKLTYTLNNQSKSYNKLIEQDAIDLMFFTHQRPPFIAPLINSAKNQKIPTACFIFSWDNLASKGRMAGDFDHYLVWSELMKTELLHYYQSIKVEQISVVGTPQFEPYVLERYATDKEWLNNSLKLNPEFKTIYFSCGDISTSKNDELYIETIASFIEKNLLAFPVNYIVRTSPAESPERFYFLKDKYPNIIWNYPKWLQSRENHQEPWSQRVPLMDDMIMLRALLAHSDLNINMCSTMSLDFMLFEKPVINPVFGNPSNGLYNDQRYLEYLHYKMVIDSGAVRIAKDADQLLTMINGALKNPSALLNEQKNILNLEIGKPLLQTGKRISETLLQIIKN